MTTMRSASVIASAWSWVTMMIAASTRWRSCASSTRVRMRNAASRLDKGSSSRNSLGRLTIARPIATRWRCPPDNCAGLRSSSSSISSTRAASSISAARSRPAARARCAVRTPYSRARSCAGKARNAGTPWRRRARPAASVSMRSTVEADLASVGGFQPGDDPQQGRLARS